MALSVVAVLGVGATLVWAVTTNGNTNANANKNANTNTSTVQRVLGDFDNDGVGGLSKTNKAESIAEIQNLLEALPCINCTDPAKRTAQHSVSCPAASNINGDAKVDANDAIYAIQYVFGNGPAPVGQTTVTCPKPSPTPIPSPTVSPKPTPSVRPSP